MESLAQLPQLTEALLRRGLDPDTIHRLLGGNVLRVLDTLPPPI
ncbi:membrane dipeptidase [Nocardia amikacinitolerans]|nr:membrane dipeptidase [Nocardia amikacinitolerans]